MKKRKSYAVISIILVIALLLVGCQTAKKSSTNETVDVATTSKVIVDKTFSARDLEVGYEETTACKVVFNNQEIEVSKEGATAKDGILTISKAGTYIISGTSQKGQIIVDAKDTDKIQIVLNGVSLTCSDFAPIYIKNADKVFLTLVENTINTLIDGAEYTQIDETNVDGVIFSKSDLTINGSGTLAITGNYQHGIVSKDDLVITGGDINITALKDALNGKNCVKIKDGILELSTETGNGIQSKNAEDTTKGYVYIAGGKIIVSKCQEGIEGTVIIVEDGTINVTAQDDGFNAASGKIEATKTDAAKTEPGDFNGGGGSPFEIDSNCYIEIAGGTININARGDGIDSNGSLYVTGGTCYVSGPTNGGNGALDYNGTATITGGTFVVSGSTGMAQGFSDTSKQYSLLYNLTTVVKANVEVQLLDPDKKVIASFTPKKEYQSVVISTPDLIKNGNYTLVCGDQTAEITLSEIVTSNGNAEGGRPDGGTGGKGEQPEGGPTQGGPTQGEPPVGLPEVQKP